MTDPSKKIDFSDLPNPSIPGGDYPQRPKGMLAGDWYAQPPAEFERTPMRRSEYISAMVHFYRGELGRANAWRLRLDITTNWAIISAMGLMSFAFSSVTHSHASIVLGMLLVLHYLFLEARRYRFFDVWRNRVRMVEENFYEPLIRRHLYSREQNWNELVAEDLVHPRFKITYLQAFRARLQRNFMALFLIMLLAWLAKLMMHPEVHSEYWVERMAIGEINWYWTLGLVAAIYGFLIAILVFVDQVATPEYYQWTEENSKGKITDF